MQIPLFPLSTVVLPDGLLPLRLFEPRYIDMVKNCFKTNTGFGVCLIKDGQEAGSPALPYSMGTLVSIIDFDQGPDGLLHITAQGEQEFNLSSYSVNSDNLLIGEVELYEQGEPTPMTPEYQDLAHKLSVILQFAEPNVMYKEKHLDNANWVCNRLLELLPLSASSKFEMLQLMDGKSRLNALSNLQIEFSSEM